MDKNMFIILVAGGSGSGKSTVSDYIAGIFPDKSVVIRHDDYYRYQTEPDYNVRALVNYDRPEAYETELLEKHLRMLTDSVAVDAPVYNFEDHNRSGEVRHIEPKPILILDGILVLAEERLRRFADLCVYVDADEETRLNRRILRDGKERNRSPASVISQFNRTVKPMHDMYVEPSKRYADIVISGSGDNREVLERLIKTIRDSVCAE